MATWKSWLIPKSYGPLTDAGLGILRAGMGGAMATHGWAKLTAFSEKAEGFYSFMGLGGEISLALTVFAEFFCALFLVLGLGTRLVLIPLIILSAVIVFDVHWADPFSKMEKGLMYLLAFVALWTTGPGRFSVDYLFKGMAAGR